MATSHTLWTYPWDAAETGPGEAALEIAGAGLDAVSLAATYHAFDQLRPRSDDRRLLGVPGSAAYYPFTRERFDDAILPQSSDLLTGAEWLDVARAFKSQALDVVAWTIFLHNSYLADQHPGVSQVTCTGDRLRHQLCPAQPQVRSYARALASDICRLDEVDVLECESISYGGFGHTHFHPKVGVDLGTGGRFLFSLCFCSACVAGANRSGLDAEGLRDRVARRVREILASGIPVTESIEELLASDPELASFQHSRETTVATLISEVVDAAGKPVRILAMGDRHTSALDVRSIAHRVDAIEYLCYTDDPDRIRRTIGEAADEAGSPSKLGIGLQAYPPASRSAEDLETSIHTVREAGVDLISFYNYGIMPPANMAWIRQALAAR